LQQKLSQNNQQLKLKSDNHAETHTCLLLFAPLSLVPVAQNTPVSSSSTSILGSILIALLYISLLK
jgi:hypothetical protein